jgi:uridylate kinase
MTTAKFKRILLKLSGEALAGAHEQTIDQSVLEFYAREIRAIHELGVEIAVVVGGGNIWRGGQKAIALGMDPAQSHYMGMLATIINALALQDALERHGMHTRTMTAIKMDEVTEPYLRRRAARHLEKHCEVILMAKNGVDGVYTADPRRNPDATRYDKLTYMDAIQQGLTVMDSTALTFCMDNNIPIVVFNPNDPGTIRRILMGEHVGTLVSNER